jgi:hypothetical protein
LGLIPVLPIPKLPKGKLTTNMPKISTIAETMDISVKIVDLHSKRHICAKVQLALALTI